MTVARNKPVLLYVVTEDWYFWSHRLPVARAARAAGWEVMVATRVAKHGERIRREGFRLVPIGLRRRSLAPWREAAAIAELARLYRRERPDLVHHVAMKPVLYGSLAAVLAGVPAVVNALAGMGYVFTSSGVKARLLRPLVRTAFRWLLDRPNSRLILQNPDDVAAMTGAAMTGAAMTKATVSAERVALIRGSGVDTQIFRPRDEPDERRLRSWSRACSGTRAWASWSRRPACCAGARFPCGSSWSARRTRTTRRRSWSVNCAIRAPPASSPGGASARTSRKSGPRARSRSCRRTAKGC